MVQRFGSCHRNRSNALVETKRNGQNRTADSRLNLILNKEERSMKKRLVEALKDVRRHRKQQR